MSDPRAPAAALTRSLRLGSAGLRLTGQLVGGGLRARVSGRDRNWEPVGELLRDVLGELKGPVLKIGQTLSQYREVLPQPVTDALSALRDDVPSMPFERVRRQLADELPGPLSTHFARFDPEPFAAASLGQVHLGRLHDGRDVVIKVQYPGMAAICAADLRQLRRLLPLARLSGVPRDRLEAIHDELARTITRELDYRQERAALERFRQRYADWPDVRLPEPVPSHCTDRVLTLTYEPAPSLEEAQAFPVATRQALAGTLARFAATQMLVHGELHADPHAGNFGFREDGTLVVYDFGCTTEVPNRVRHGYASAYRALRAGEAEGLEPALQALGGRRPASAPPWALYRELVRVLQPALTPGVRWDFSDGTLHAEAIALMARTLEWLQGLQPPPETVLVNRTLDGHYWTLVALRAELEIDAVIAPLLPGAR